MCEVQYPANLRVGDLILLRQISGAYVSADAIVSDDCYVLEEVDFFVDCLWEVHVQYQYGAMKEYKTALCNICSFYELENLKDLDSVLDLETINYLKQLEQAVVSERLSNERLMKVKKGKTIIYGDIIQLRHVKSKKFLCVSMTELAKGERENMRIFLDSEGSSQCCFVFSPKMKHDLDGQPILEGSEIYVKSHTRSSEYLHVAKKDVKPFSYEVNCSLECSVFRLLVFEHAEDMNIKYVLAGDLVSFQEPESGWYLVINENSKVVIKPFTQGLTCNSVGTHVLWQLECVDPAKGGTLSQLSAKVVLRHLNTCLYIQIRDDEVVTVNNRREASAFEISSPNLSDNGLVKERAMVYLSSEGCYLSSKPFNSKSDELSKNCCSADSRNALSFILSAEIYRKIGVDIFVGVCASKQLRVLTNMLSMKGIPIDNKIENALILIFSILQYCCRFLERCSEEIVLELTGNYNYGGTLMNGTTLRQAMLREQGFINSVLDLVEICSHGNNYLLDYLNVVGDKSRLFERTHGKVYWEKIRAAVAAICKNRGETSCSFASSKGVVSFPYIYEEIINVFFCRNFTAVKVASSPNNVDCLKEERKNTIPFRMKLRVNNSLPCSSMVRCKIGDTLPYGYNLHLSKVEANLNKSFIRFCSESQKGFNCENRFSGSEDMPLISKLIQACLNALLFCVKANDVSQFLVADRLPLLLEQCKSSSFAVECVQELLCDNIEILRWKVGENEIKMLFQLMVESEMNVTFLKLIQGACSLGFDATQALVINALFSLPKEQVVSCSDATDKNCYLDSARRVTGNNTFLNYPDFLLVVVLDKEALSFIPEISFNSIFLPTKVSLIKQVFGYPLLECGAEKVFIQMPDRNIARSSFGLKKKIPIEMIYLYSPSNDGYLESLEQLEDYFEANIGGEENMYHSGCFSYVGDLKNESVTNISANCIKLGKFLISQFYLIGDLCRNRQYSAISKFEKLYEYEIFINLLSIPNLPNDFKASICHALRFLYVDREPQLKTVFPRLIRTSASLASDENGYDFCQGGSPFKFALLQQLISVYMEKDLKSTECDSLSCEMMQLLHDLTSFGFYFTDVHLRSIIRPLIDALHLHAFSHEEVVSLDSNSLASDNYSKIVDFARILHSKGVSFYEFLLRKCLRAKEIDQIISDSFSKGSIAAAWLIETEKSRYLLLILLLVIASVFVGLFELIASPNPESAIYFAIVITDAIFSCFFTLEVVFRIICYCILFHDFVSFWIDFFNILDTVAVCLDIFVFTFGLDPSYSHGAEIFRALKVLRVFRLIRSLRAAKLINNYSRRNFIPWSLPERFASLGVNECSTLVNILKTLCYILNRLQDKRLGTSFKAFNSWSTEFKHLNASKVFLSSFTEESDLWKEIPDNFDKSLADLLMFKDNMLLQQTLNLLMNVKCSSKLLGDAMVKLLIVCSPDVEAKYKEIVCMMRDLKRMAEMYEIWGNLKTNKDCATAEELLSILCRMSTLMMKSSCASNLLLVKDCIDSEMQHILRNIDAMSTFMLIQVSLFDDSKKTPLIISKILIASNNLICQYLHGNCANQESAYKHLKWFIARVDDNIASSAVVRALLRGNLTLIKNLPTHYFGEFAGKILTNGHKPEYLDIFVAVVERSDSGVPVRVKSIENEVVKYLTSREWKDQITLWCSPIHSIEFEARRDAMLKFSANFGEVNDVELPPMLRYHVNYLTLIANCNLGPKLQSLYALEDVLNGIIDSATIFPVRRSLGYILYVMCSSDIKIPGIDVSQLMWQFLEVTLLYFEELENELGDLLRINLKPLARLQQIEWVQVCLSIVSAFFKRFDLTGYLDLLSKESDFGIKISTLSEVDVLHFTSRLYTTILTVKNRHGMFLDDVVQNCFINCLRILVSFSNFSLNSNDNEVLYSQKEEMEELPISSTEVHRDIYRNQFDNFFAQMFECQRNLYVDSVLFFEAIPLASDSVHLGDARLEHILQNLTDYVGYSIKLGAGSRALARELDDFEISLWLIKTWRLLLEKHLKLEIESYCKNIREDPVEVTDYAVNLQNLYNSCGVTKVCLQLVAVGIEEQLVLEAIYLLICLLFGCGPVTSVQIEIVSYLQSSSSTLFFQKCNEYIDRFTELTYKAADFVTEREITKTSYMDEEHMLVEVAIFRFLQLACRGNFTPFQMLAREQSNGSKVFSIMGGLAVCLQAQSRAEGPLFTCVAIHVVQTIQAFVRGPCKENQEFFVLDAEVLVCLNKFLRISDLHYNENNSNIIHLKESCVDLLKAFVENQSFGSIILDRVASSIELNLLHTLLLSSISSQFSLNGISSKFENSHVLVPLLSKYLILRYNLIELVDDPALAIPNVEMFEELVSFVEINWNGTIHRHFYYIPDIVKDLTYFTNDLLYEALESSTREMQLRTFVTIVRSLYAEAIHQRTLSKVGFSNISYWKKLVIHVRFLNALLINGILVFAYKKVSCWYDYNTSEPLNSFAEDNVRRLVGSPSEQPNRCFKSYLSGYYAKVVLVLSSIQIFLSTITIAIILLGSVPTAIRKYRDSGYEFIVSILKAMLDPALAWCFVYFVFCFLGLFYYPLFLSTLLLDFVVIDGTTGDVLCAVLDPVRQLISAFALVCIVVYIFAVVVFELFWFDIITFSVTSLWETVKVTLSYGIRGEYGVSYEMKDTTGSRMIFDLFFYVVVLLILKNIFHAIIIDGFGKLRELKIEREAYANNTCFICGIDRHEFNRFIGRGLDGFSNHRLKTHNLWSYVLFIVLILQQSPDDDDGIERYVRRCLKFNDVNWFPVGLTKQSSMKCDKNPKFENDFSNKMRSFENSNISSSNKPTSAAEKEIFVNELGSNLSSGKDFIDNQNTISSTNIRKLLVSLETNVVSIEEEICRNNLGKEILEKLDSILEKMVILREKFDIDDKD